MRVRFNVNFCLLKLDFCLAVFCCLLTKQTRFCENEVRLVATERTESFPGVTYIRRTRWFLLSRSFQETISEDLRATLNAFLYRTGEQSKKSVPLNKRFVYALSCLHDGIVFFRLQRDAVPCE